MMSAAVMTRSLIFRLALAEPRLVVFLREVFLREVFLRVAFFFDAFLRGLALAAAVTALAAFFRARVASLTSLLAFLTALRALRAFFLAVFLLALLDPLLDRVVVFLREAFFRVAFFFVFLRAAISQHLRSFGLFRFKVLLV